MTAEIVGERIYIVRTLAGETLIAEADSICLGECKLRWPLHYSERLEQVDHPDDAAKPEADRRKVPRASWPMMPLSVLMPVGEYHVMVASWYRVGGKMAEKIIARYREIVDQVSERRVVTARTVPLEGLQQVRA